MNHDTTRCTGQGCPHKQDCQRYLALSTDRMDVVRKVPVMVPTGGECGLRIPAA